MKMTMALCDAHESALGVYEKQVVSDEIRREMAEAAVREGFTDSLTTTEMSDSCQGVDLGEFITECFDKGISLETGINVLCIDKLFEFKVQEYLDKGE